MIERCDRPAVIAALLASALAIAAPTSARAERAVGLEAQGVDPQAALDNPEGLDVRDELGRPVSAALIRAQLKKAQATAAADAAYASRLPQARRVTAALELLAGLSAALRRALPDSPWRWFADAALPRPAQRLPAAAALVFSFALALRCRARAVFAQPISVPTKVVVLRC